MLNFCFRKNLIAILLIAGLFSCNKLDDNIGIQGQVPDFVTKVTASVTGFVTNENGDVIEGASVTAGSSTATTDEYGYFEINDVLLVEEAAVVTVKHIGYFNGIRTFMAEEGKSKFIRIQLLQKNLAGSINSTSGGSVSLTNGMAVTLPASSVTLSGSSYTGQVNVFATWIDPTSPHLSSRMPGDLRAVNTQGYMKMLETYGMVGVELETPSGDKLEITAGKKATVTFPLPASLNSTAPQTIPLWHFNEETGLWVEEGQAIKTGNSYVGDVAHFSFWNCDIPMEYVQLSATLVDAVGNPVSQVCVKLSDINNPNMSAHGWTDINGYVSGAVPANRQLQMEVVIPGVCSSLVQTITVGSSNVSLGNITLPNLNAIMNVVGTVTDCNGQPLDSGSVFVNAFGSYFNYPVINGNYSFIISNCGTPVTASFIAHADTMISNVLTHIINPGNNVIPDLQACASAILSYDGIFSMNGFHDRVNFNLPYTNVEMHMVTVDSNTVAFYWPAAGDFGHPFMTATGISWYGPTIAPRIIFNRTTNVITGAYNGGGAVPINLYTGPIPTQNYYDPVTRKIYVAWEYNSGSIPRAFFDTLTYIGPR